jgi:hypothetical protein
MAVYEVEMRVVEIHTYRVEAESAEEAVDLAWDDPSPTFIEHVCQEVADVTETELKEDFVAFSKKMDKFGLTDKDYYDLRGANIPYLTGTEK